MFPFLKALAITDWAVIIVANSPSYSITPPSSLLLDAFLSKAPLSVLSAVMSACSVPIIKISIAVVLFRLVQSNLWRRFLYSIIALQVVMAIYGSVMQMTRCIPINGLWDGSIKDKRCWSVEAFRMSLVTISALTSATDVIFSLIPLTFIVHVRRSTRERIMVCVLMSLGLFASAASIVKTVVTSQFEDNGKGDQLMISGLKIAFWSSLEEQLGLITACLPCLKSYFQRVFAQLGVESTQAPSSNDWYPVGLGGGIAQSRSTRRHDSPVGLTKLDRVLGPQSDKPDLVPHLEGPSWYSSDIG